MFKEWNANCETLWSYSHANQLEVSVGDYTSGDVSVIYLRVVHLLNSQ